MNLTPEQLAVLDRAITAGGVNLAAKILTEAGGKAATALLTPLVDLGWLVKEGTKFTLTPEGRTAWEQQAPAERVAEVRAREAAVQKERVLAFLNVVETKGKLSAAEAKKWTATIAKAEGEYVARGAKANTFTLLPAGEMLLLAAKPVAEQLEAMQALHAELSTRWRAIQERWHDALTHDALRPASADITTQAQEALDTLKQSTAAASVFDSLASAAATVQQELTAKAATVQAAEARLQELTTQQRIELARLEDDFAERFALFQKFLPTAPTPSPTATPTVDLWEATRTAYADLSAQASKIGGIVKVPELADAVRAHVPTLSHADYLRQLQEWERADQLTLQVCNDRHLEPRASEGIDAPRGLLFYVVLR